MARTRSRFVCQECGFQTTRYLGRCTECNSWNSLVEEPMVDESTPPRARALSRASAAGPGPLLLDDLESDQNQRTASGLAGVDDVLGGGLVPGAVILLAGDPGVGKSTLLLQISEIIGQAQRILYIAGEESAQQVKLRAQRLGLTSSGILVAALQDVETIQAHIAQSGAQVLIVDSIQSVFTPALTSAPGTVSQVRESAGALIATAKAGGIATILVGHVTKDGSIAGPRVLEHMVDVVLHFEGDRSRQLRILRAVKNRYGSTHEVGVFTMTDKGLKEVDNPSSLFLGDRLTKLDHERAPSGTAVIAGAEGSKSLLLEVQALVGTSPYPNPRRVVNGWDLNRLLQILAVLEKKAGLPISRNDVYVNIAGGFEFSDPAGDLGVSVAVATSCLDRSVDPRLVLIGEIGLTGEVRPVGSLERRVKEASRLGFRRALVPKSNLPLSTRLDHLELVGIEYLLEALELVMPGQKFASGGQAAGLAPEPAGNLELGFSRIGA